MLLGGAVAPAQASGSAGSELLHGDQLFSAYTTAGDTVSASFRKDMHVGAGSSLAFDLVDPEGTSKWTCEIRAEDPVGQECSTGPLSGPAGVWEMRLTDSTNIAANTSLLSWNVNVANSGVNLPGRVWTSEYHINQQSAEDLRFWAVTDAGYIYSISLNDYNGVYSVLSVDSVGNAVEPGSCTPQYASAEGGGNRGTGSCLKHRMFFEPPAEDLPISAPSASGVVKIRPPVLDADSLAVTDMAFTPLKKGSREGTFSYSINPAFTGGYRLEIDADGNGDFDDPVDRVIQAGADGSGTYTTEFDGLDGQGNPISPKASFNARIFFDRFGEIHFTNVDVEGRAGGLEIVRTYPSGAGDDRIFWDDTKLADNRANNTEEVDGTAGVPSTGGVHRWDYNNNSWGNGRTIDDWTYIELAKPTGEIRVGTDYLGIEKTSNATTASKVGDTVTYEVTATNLGDTDYTVDNPAVVVDDLAGVLDDASYGGNATARINGADSGSIEYEEPRLQWSGALAAGESVTLSYSVTLRAGGDGRVRNIAFSGTEGQEIPDTPECVNPVDGRDADSGVLCDREEFGLGALAISKSVDPATGSTVTVGEKLTYTLSFQNSGEADVAVNHEDLISDVLDDAELSGKPAASSSALQVAEVQDGRIGVTGTVAPGTTETVKYEVVVRGDGKRGNDTLANFLVPEGETKDTCEPGDTDCTVNPVADLRVSKTADPKSGAAVVAGDEITYTLAFENTSKNKSADPVSVDYVDHLSDVLDDAELVGEAAASDPALQAALSGDQLTVTGSLVSGQKVTVSYRVKVKQDSARGNSLLENVVAPIGVDPVCEKGSAMCTQHPVDPTPIYEEFSDDDGALPVTGGDGTLWLPLAALGALILGSGVAVWARRRSVSVS